MFLLQGISSHHPHARGWFQFFSNQPYLLISAVVQGILLGSYNFRKLAVSAEAQHSACRVKIQLLMILIETLDMENLLQMVQDGVPFRFV